VDRQLHSVSAGAKARHVDSHAAAGNPVCPLRNLLPLNAKAGRAIGESKSFRGAAQPADTNLFYRECEPNRLTGELQAIRLPIDAELARRGNDLARERIVLNV